MALAKPQQPTLNRRHPLARGLVFAFANCEKGGSPKDVVNGFVATQNGTASWANAAYGPAMSFPASTSAYYQIAYDSRMSTTALSFSLAWVANITTGTTEPGGFAIMLNQGGSSSALKIYMLRTPTNGTPAARLKRYNEFDSGITLTLGVTYRIVYALAATSDTAGTETFYVWGSDGSSASASQTGTIVNSSNTAISIGATPAGHAMGGIVDALCMWTGRCLTAAEAGIYAADPFGVMRVPRRALGIGMVPTGLPLPVLMAGYRRRRVG